MKKILEEFYNKIPFPIYLASKRLLPRSYTLQFNLLPKLALFSIIIGVAASILILSLTNGLHYKYLERLAEKDAHIMIVSAGKGIPAYQEVIQKIKTLEDIVQVFPYSQNEALIKSYGETSGIIIKSYPNSFKDDKTFNKIFTLQNGLWSFDQKRSITIGESLARNMSLFIGDYIEILTYDDIFGAITYRFKIVGVFTANDALLDLGIAFINFDDASEIFNFRSYTPYIGIRINNYLHPEKVTTKLKALIPFRFKTWKLANLNTLLALGNEKRIIQVLLLIFFCVAFFGILAVITAMVAEKKEEIALLKALGVSPKINSISFILTGLFLGIISSCIGIILGVFLSMQFNNIVKIIELIINSIIQGYGFIIGEVIKYKFTFLNQSVYYLKEFPILVKISDIILTCISAILCTVLASVYPAYISKEFRPAEILRKRT